jgi:hypothetical protein
MSEAFLSPAASAARRARVRDSVVSTVLSGCSSSGGFLASSPGRGAAERPSVAERLVRLDEVGPDDDREVDHRLRLSAHLDRTDAEELLHPLGRGE